MKQVMWRTWAALAVVALAVAFEWWWVWGAWMCYYAVTGIRQGVTFLVEPVPRRGQPLLFWIVTAVWAGLGILMLIADGQSFLSALAGRP